MPASINDEGVIVKSTKLGETDVILIILTRNNGKISAVAKGARSKNTKFGGSALVFNRSLLKFTLGRNLDIINEMELIDAFSDNISTDYNNFLVASQMVNIVDKIVVELHETTTNQYLLLVRALKFIASQSFCDYQITSNLVGLSYIVRALSLAGFEIQSDNLLSSGIVIPQQYNAEEIEEVFDALLQGNWQTFARFQHLPRLEEQLTKIIAKFATTCLEARLITFRT